MAVIDLQRDPFQHFLERLNAMRPLSEREAKLIWHLLACLNPSPLSLLDLHTDAAYQGLDALVGGTHAGHTTEGNLAITEMLAHAKRLLRHQGYLPADRR